MILQNLIVLFVVAGAAYVAWRHMAGLLTGSGGCGCSGKPCARAEGVGVQRRPLVQLSVLDSQGAADGHPDSHRQQSIR